MALLKSNGVTMVVTDCIMDTPSCRNTLLKPHMNFQHSRLCNGHRNDISKNNLKEKWNVIILQNSRKISLFEKSLVFREYLLIFRSF